MATIERLWTAMGAEPVRMDAAAARPRARRGQPPAARGGLRAGGGAGPARARRRRGAPAAADLQPARHDARRRVEPGDVARHLPRQPRRGAAADRGAGAAACRSCAPRSRPATPTASRSCWSRARPGAIASSPGSAMRAPASTLRSLRRWRCAGAAAPRRRAGGACRRARAAHAAPTTAICGTWCPATPTRWPTSIWRRCAPRPGRSALMQGEPRRRSRGAASRASATTCSPRRSACWSRATEAAGGAEHADHRARPLRRRARRRRVPRRDAGRGRDAVARQPAVGGAGAGGRAGHAAHAGAGRRPARAGRDRRGLGRSSPTRAAARSASCAARSTPTRIRPR